MRLSVSLLLLLTGNAIVSTENCTVQPPEVLHAQLVNPKNVYEKGETVRYSCDTGYTSGRQIKYFCTDNGWKPEHRGICRLKPCVLPDDIPNGYYQMITGEDFVFGTTIKYYCNEGYQMISKEDTRTCFVNEWSNHLPVCEPLSCDAPPETPGVSVEGLPIEEGPILPNHFITFSCDSLVSTLNGSATLVCGKDGQWDKPFPNCVGVTCPLPAPNPKMRVIGPEGVVVAGGSVTVQCVSRGYSKQLQCLQTGRWSSTFPTCNDYCDVVNVADSVSYKPRQRQLQIRQILTFSCKTRGHELRGQAKVACSEGGEWSHPFPSCTDPLSCGPPPSLEDGDFFASGQTFSQYSQVQYQCQDKYVMEGGPNKICRNGVWTGDIKCLKPCTVNPDLMQPNKIKFRYGSKQKLYAIHEDGITFACIAGARATTQNMRVTCNDGVMLLPTCV